MTTVNWNGQPFMIANGLLFVYVNGFELALLPGEDVAEVVARAEAVLQEKEDRPGLGLEVDDDCPPWLVGEPLVEEECDELGLGLDFDAEPDELELMAADLATLLAGRMQPIVVMDDELLSAIEAEQPGAYEYANRWAW